MNSTTLKQNTQESHLKVIQGSLNRKTGFDEKIYINTLFPGFSYVNELGKTITPRKCILL